MTSLVLARLFGQEPTALVLVGQPELCKSILESLAAVFDLQSEQVVEGYPYLGTRLAPGSVMHATPLGAQALSIKQTAHFVFLPQDLDEIDLPSFEFLPGLVMHVARYWLQQEWLRSRNTGCYCRQTLRLFIFYLRRRFNLPIKVLRWAGVAVLCGGFVPMAEDLAFRFLSFVAALSAHGNCRPFLTFDRDAVLIKLTDTVRQANNLAGSRVADPYVITAALQASGLMLGGSGDVVHVSRAAWDRTRAAWRKRVKLLSH